MLTVNAKEVATSPGFQPPYQALTITATANTAKRLSAISENSRAGIRARVVLSTATPYRRIGSRVGGMKRVRRRGRFCRIRVNLRAAKRKRRVTAVHMRVAQTARVLRGRGPSGPISRRRVAESTARTARIRHPLFFRNERNKNLQHAAKTGRLTGPFVRNP